MFEIAYGLNFLHEHSILHGDLRSVSLLAIIDHPLDYSYLWNPGEYCYRKWRHITCGLRHAFMRPRWYGSICAQDVWSTGTMETFTSSNEGKWYICNGYDILWGVYQINWISIFDFNLRFCFDSWVNNYLHRRFWLNKRHSTMFLCNRRTSRTMLRWKGFGQFVQDSPNDLVVRHGCGI